jgi:hypothetical protein
MKLEAGINASRYCDIIVIAVISRSVRAILISSLLLAYYDSLDSQIKKISADS